MAKKKVTTQSLKRYRYSSFKDRIENLKINKPLLRSSKRDLEVEISNFYERYEHWKEINITGNFTDFINNNEQFFQTLPQLIYHKNKIYEELIIYLTKEDNIELTFEPLLDLLSLFVHDLGEDFYEPFFEKTVNVLVDLSVKNFDNSNILEWIFNCLGFIFKFLSPVLSKNLTETFKFLIPLYRFNKSKAHLSRFASEALSFLIKKVQINDLQPFVKLTVDYLLDDSGLNEALVLMYSESMANVNGALYSKSQHLLNVLLDISSTARSTTSLVCDILLNILAYANFEASAAVYKTVLEKITTNVKFQEQLKTNLQLLITIGFAQSGKKISSWSDYLKTLELCFECANGNDVEINNAIVQLASIIMRNCELLELAKFHVKLFQFMSTLNNGNHFFPFIETSLDFSTERVISFGAKYTQDFLNSHWQSLPKEIALFSSQLNSRDLISKFELVVPHGLQLSVELYLHQIDEVENIAVLKEIHWRLLILRNVSDVEIAEDLSRLLTLLIQSGDKHSMFQQDLVGLLLQSLSRQQVANPAIIMTNIFEHFDKFKLSSEFLIGVLQFIKSFKQTEILIKHLDQLLKCVSENVSSASHEVRYTSLSIIITALSLTSNEVPPLISQCQIIEDIPLTLQTARDIQLRTRSLASEYASNVVDSLVADVVPRFLFGLLTVRFKPSWDAAYDAIVAISSKADDKIWNLAYEFIVRDYSSDETSDSYTYSDEAMITTFPLVDNHQWLVQDHRLNDNTAIAYKYIESYVYLDRSLIKSAEEKRSDTSYRSIMRGQALTALSKVPEIAEAHSASLIPLLLNEENNSDEYDEELEITDSSSTWNLTDRNLLISLFEKFKNLKSFPKSDQVYDHMLMLLANRHSLVLKSALNCIFNFKNPHINKYRDNFKNLLDDTLFRDELFKFVATEGDRTIIEGDDEEDVMKLVLRILFGRFQTSKSNGMNKGKKFAVISVLPSLLPLYIIDFLKFGSDRIPYHGFKESNTVDPVNINSKLLRREIGLINLLTEVIGVLGSGFNDVLATTIEPLVYSLSVAQYAIGDMEKVLDSRTEAAARRIRTMGMRCLNDLFHQIKDFSFWMTHIDAIYQNLISPRLYNFAEENLQQPSSLLKILVCWGTFEDYQKFLFMDGLKPLKALLSLLSNENTKDAVLSLVFDFCLAFSKTTSLNDDFIEGVSIVVESALSNLSTILDRVGNKEVNSKAVALLLSLSENGYIEDHDTKKTLINSLVNAFDKPATQVDNKDKVNILKALSSIVENFDCSRNEIIPLFETCSKSFKHYSDKKIRQSMCDVFVIIGGRFPEFEIVGKYVNDLNSFASSRMDEPDFERRLSAFKEINESSYLNLSHLSWLPLIYCALFFMNDKDELSIRTNATYMLCRFVDCFSSKSSLEGAKPFTQLLKDIILPLLRLGLRSEEEVVQTEYISLLSHIVSSSQYYHDLDDMKVLLFDGDEEANFFSNVNHIQLHRRQRAIRRLRNLKTGLSDGSISHYIIPMIENYAFSEEEKLQNIASDTIETIGNLSCSMSWNQFKAILKRYISYLSSKRKPLRSSVHLIVSISTNFSSRVAMKEKGDGDEKLLLAKDSEIFQFITKEVMPQLSKILSLRDDDTIIMRLPLSEALTSLVVCLELEKISNELPGILTSVCQVMRSRSEELRDAVRKNLGKLAKILGPSYFKFLIQELKSALSRGSQIHVLSFTVHYLLVVMSDELKHGDLDESAQILIDIVMEDTFGAAGQEKDAEGYTSKMKEVKHNKSFDTAEILASKTTLNNFSILITPIKLLLAERIALKSQNRLEELLRRYALGLNHNEDSSKREILVLCYQLYEQSNEIFDNSFSEQKKNKSQAADHFLVKLNARSQKTQNEYSLYSHTLQKFSLELLRVAVSRNESLATTTNLEGFVPLLETSLHSDNEGVIISSIKVLNSIIKLPFSETIDNIFKSCARTVLTIIKDSPTTNSELSQASLKFLSTLLRHKPDIKLKDTALSYILTRIQPDLQEPNKQGLAFNFLNALVSSHVMIAEIYDTMDKVREIMITNHTKEIRDISRNVYYKFLMEYDQSRGRLEKQFKFLVDNLQYPTESGRQSVMGLLHFIINKAGSELLSHLSSSFFVSLAMVMTSDDSSKCREMAGLLISSIFKKLGKLGVDEIEKYISSWTSQISNPLLVRCGLQTYKLFIAEFGLEKNKDLDLVAMQQFISIMNLAKKLEEGEDVEWELIYAALTVFTSVATIMEESAYQPRFLNVWQNVIDSLLYPHPWVRLASCRLIGNYVNRLESLKLSNYAVQTIAYRLLRQLAAPGISEQLGSQIVKNLAKITIYWKLKGTPYVDANDVPDQKNFTLATHWAISRTSSIMRNELGDNLSVGKKSAIQYTALLIQILSPEELLESAETIILPLYNFSQSNNAQDEELMNLALETLGMLESALGISNYTQSYAKVQQRVYERRRERKSKRSQLAITAPDVSAKRKMRKHERFREKRKHEKDDNGYYKEKRKKIDRMTN